MNNYPTHYPKNCPPNHSVPASGDVYRFINGTTPKDKDFKSYYELKPHQDWGSKACEARGLSVFITLEDCIAAAKVIPAFRNRKKLLAKASLPSNSGVIAPTPSKNTNNHNTFWSLVSAQDLSLLFHSVPNMGDTNV